jgi:hypothetical protein
MLTQVDRLLDIQRTTPSEWSNLLGVSSSIDCGVIGWRGGVYVWVCPMMHVSTFPCTNYDFGLLNPDEAMISRDAPVHECVAAVRCIARE